MPTVIELRTERLQLVTQGRAIADKAKAEKREMTAEESANFDKFMDDSDLKLKEIEKLEADDKRRTRLATAEADLAKRTGRQVDPPNPDPHADDEKKANVFEFARRSARCGQSTRRIDFSALPKNLENLARPEYRAGFRGFLRDGGISPEFRALQVDLDTQGGYLVVPQQYAAELIAIVDNEVFIRRLATVITLTSATTLGVPSRDVDIADSDWTSELATGNEDTLLSFGKRELSPHPLAKRIKVSNKLLRAGALDVESIVKDRLAYKFGVTQEKAFLLGSGAQQPLGLFTPTANGISTARDVVTGSATNYTADGLINAKYFLKPQYWDDARWIFHRFGIQRIRQLKDTNGQYLWAPSGIGQANLKDGVADTILGLPYVISEYCPNTFTTGLYTGILGDFSFYWIVDALSMQVQRLVELYAEKNQTGFIARMEIDGAPVLEEAFVRVINS